MRQLLQVILFYFASSVGYGQDLYLKETTNFSSINAGSPSIKAFSDGSFVTVSASSNNQNTTAITLILYNKCGEIILSKRIEHAQKIRLVESTIDQNDNLIISGDLDNGSIKEPFLLSIAKDGSINFFNRYQTNTNNLSCLTYSLAVTPTNEYYLYINFDVTTSGPASRPSLLKLNSNGAIIWYKLHDFHSWHYGFMTATADNGALYTMSNSFIKVNQFGDVEWKKTLNGRFNPMKGIVTDRGYVFATLNNSSTLPINFLMLDKEGGVKWSIVNFNTYLATDAVLKKNGNILYVGRYNGSRSSTTLEINPIDGTAAAFKNKLIDINYSRMSFTSLTTDNQDNILYSGVHQLNTFPQLIVHKANDTIGQMNCTDAVLQAAYTIDTADISTDATPVTISRSNVTLFQEAYRDSTVSYANNTLCSYFKDRGMMELGNDTVLCSGNQLQIGNNSSNFDAYLWSTGERSKTITVNQPGTYRLSVLSACDTISDSITVHFRLPTTFSLGNDTVLCAGDSITLTPNRSLTNYLWSNGEAKAAIKIGQAGTYWLASSDSCGTFSDSIVISQPSIPSLNLGNDTILCPDDTLQIGQTGFDFYQWSTGENTPFITIGNAGSYSLIAGNVCDTANDSFNLNFHPKTVVDPFVSSRNTYTNEPITFIDQSTPKGSSSWNMGDGSLFQLDSVTHGYTYPGTYTVLLSVISDEGCVQDSALDVIILPSTYAIPNVFSPNGDGINDVFEPYGRDISSVKYLIRNRWGTVVFESDDIPWDGQLKSGVKANSGTYFYTLTLTFIDGLEVTKSGDVFLTR
jgi:gliding motility-associated-like protein